MNLLVQNVVRVVSDTQADSDMNKPNFNNKDIKKLLATAAIRFGDGPIVLLTLLISCVAIFIGFFTQDHEFTSLYQQQQMLMKQQTAKMFHTIVDARVQALSKQMELVVQSPQLTSILASNDQKQIEVQQEALTYLFLGAQKVCLIAVSVDQTDENNSCMPITFATLDSIRLAKKDGKAPIAIIRAAKDDAHLLLAQRIMDSSEYIAGVLLVKLKPQLVNDLFDQQNNINGYIEIQQGTKNIVIKSTGDTKWKQDTASIIKPIANSHWKIAYWPAKVERSTSFMMLILLMLGTVVVMWLVREAWQQLLQKLDAATLRGELADLQQGRLKKGYYMVSLALRPVADDIKGLGVDQDKATAKKNAILKNVSNGTMKNDDND